ncbi:MAG: hypothetical protein MUD14_30295 [Hydrococcus sp. Prado102]|jgi:uncharacterized membrane protein YebE (DUF533 family)|nr:hypothetical protein [Hydrococcus sp. Prado102]
MKIIQSHPQKPTSEEAKELEKLKARIDRAVADGKISGSEMEDIKNEILTDGKGSAEQMYRELELYRTLVEQKLENGDLETEWRSFKQ